MRVVSRLSRHRRFASPLGLLLCILATWGSVGCGNRSGSICDEECACKGGCDAATHDACVRELDTSAQLSSAKGCSASADPFFECEAAKGQCIGTGLSSDACLTEKKAYFQCLSTAKCALFGNVVRCDF